MLEQSIHRLIEDHTVGEFISAVREVLLSRIRDYNRKIPGMAITDSMTLITEAIKLAHLHKYV